MVRRTIAGILAATLLLALSAGHRDANAATINVACNATALIQAIETANNEVTNPGPDTLDLAAGCTYSLTAAYAGGENGLPTVTTDVTINGHGATIARGGAAPQFRIIEVLNGGALTLGDVTLTGGRAPDGAPGQGGANGGAIYACCSGSLTFTGVRATGNRAGDGGGPAIPNGIAGAGGGGGAVFVSGSVSVSISGSSIDGNRSGDGAAGNNGGVGGSGGGLALSTSLSVVIANSTIANNVAGNGGAGTNSHGTGGRGGGLFGPAAGTLIVNSTISGNSSGFSGGGTPGTGAGIEAGTGGDIDNSIVASNLVGANCSGLFSGASNNNMASDASCGASFTQKTPAEINLGPLAVNGGPTPTTALIYPSAAIDAGDNATCAAAPVNNLDQRGATRPRDGDFNTTAICDIGAYEAAPQTGPTFDVNSTAGDNDGRCHPASEGDCTLREAITAANADGVPSAVVLGNAQTYTLTVADNAANGLPVISTPIAINGNGSIVARDPAAPRFRIFDVVLTGSLALDHMTLTGGSPPNKTAVSDADGAGIRVDSGTLTLTAVTVAGNTSGNGRAAAVGTVGGHGGGIYLAGSATAEVADSTISGNSAGRGGSGNTGNGGGGGSGGGIYVTGTASLFLSRSTVNGNNAGGGGSTPVGTGGTGGGGGGIFVDSTAFATIVNSTLTQNTAGGGGDTDGSPTGVRGSGGGLRSLSSSVYLANDTIAGNARGSTGGTAGTGGNISTTVAISAANTLAANPAVGENCAATFTGSTNNMASDATCGASFLARTPAQINLGALASNGGPTQTMALISPSSAIDTGDNTTCAAGPVNNVDQRGAVRPFDGDDAGGAQCDIGAYECVAGDACNELVVDTTSDSNLTACTSAPADCSFRGALNASNSRPGRQYIEFNVPPGGVQTIVPLTPLPAISQPATVDGTTQPGYAGTPIIRLDGNSALQDGVVITGGDSVLRGLEVNRFTSYGIRFQSSGNSMASSATGLGGVAGNGTGISIEDGSGNCIGGVIATAVCMSGPGLGNGIFNNSQGVRISGPGATANVVLGNRIGELSNGNGTGVLIASASGNRIGGSVGTTPGGACSGDCNVISGNNVGIRITSGENSAILGNFIGTNSSGDAPGGNTSRGIQVEGGPGTTIGDGSAAARNVISANGNDGIALIAASAITIRGNYVGTNSAGNADLGNAQRGIGLVGGANLNTIGGSVPGQGNLISGNDQGGVGIDGSGNTIWGNLIGTNADGATARPNSGAAGVIVLGADSTNNLIGGTGAGEGNTIAFNFGDGVLVDGVGVIHNSVRGNSIFSNNLKGIENINGGNQQLAPPVVTALGSAAGTTCANCIVDIYSGNDDEGSVYHGSAVADGAGNWSFPGAVGGPNVTATATNSAGSTSEFSCPDHDFDGVCSSVDADDDDDGYADSVEDGGALCAGAVNDDGVAPMADDAVTNDGCPAVGPSESPNCENSPSDDDLDGWVNDGCPQEGAYSEAQFKIGTGSIDPCGNNGWPSDLVSGGIPDSTNRLTIGDIVSFMSSGAPLPVRRLDKNPGQTGFDARWDLAPGKGALASWINIQDITTLLSGTTGNPPMFGTTRAFGKVCPFAP